MIRDDLLFFRDENDNPDDFYCGKFRGGSGTMRVYCKPTSPCKECKDRRRKLREARGDRFVHTVLP